MRGLIAGVGDNAVQIIGNRADIFGDAPLVIVENDNQPFGRVLDIVQGFECDPIG